MDSGLRLLELMEEYLEAREAQKWNRAYPMDTGRPVEEIAAEVEATVRALTA